MVERSEVFTRANFEPKLLNSSNPTKAMPRMKLPLATIAPEGIVLPVAEAAALYERSRFGTLLGKGNLNLSNLEALYLVAQEKIIVKKGKKKLDFSTLLTRFQKDDPRLWLHYCVFKDLRDSGYIVKTAVKFGADFRVYEKGVKPGEDHAKWIVFAVKEEEILTWQDFSAKNRVANSTRKKLLVAVLDAENDVTYYEVKWLKP